MLTFRGREEMTLEQAQKYYELAVGWYELAEYHYGDRAPRQAFKCKIDALLCIHKAKMEIDRFNNSMGLIR